MPQAATAMTSSTTQNLHTLMANSIRFLAADAVQKANSGHPGMPMGFADVATVLYRDFLKFDISAPKWADRDRFILSAGHGSMLLYSLLYLTGYEDMPIEEIKNFRQLHSRTAGHPEYGEAAGIETTTGPLGQGIANAVGMAMAEKMMNARFGDDLVNHYTYCAVGDGCLMEGISHEAISMAGHMQLNKLIVLFDDNSISIDGSTDISVSDDQCKRVEASGWNAVRVDGHDPSAIAEAIEKAKKSDKPTLIACRTTIGFGSPSKQGTAATHGAPLGEEELDAMRQSMGWDAAPFEVPEKALQSWREAGKRGAEDREAWEARLQASDKREEFERLMAGDLPADWEATLQSYIDGLYDAPEKVATRKASGNALDVLCPVVPELIGGSADLTGSNNTKAKNAMPVTPTDFSGTYLHYGVREHGMAAAMNGMALHGGIIPFSGTFLVFTDYCRPSIRLSALMKQRVIYVMTHDSIGLGEDGPTHQPVEHLASLRAMPNVNVYRPCDVVEAAECWAAALKTKETPTILALSRQGLPQMRTEKTTKNLSAKGAYILKEASSTPQAVLFATGSEVHIAAEAQETLEGKGISTRLVSVPCWELFAAQTADYQQSVLGPRGTKKVAIEAGVSQGWEQFIGVDGCFVGMNSFGASAPAGDLYKHFGITADAVVEAAIPTTKTCCGGGCQK